MTGYGQFCPVAIALEILGERWTLLVVRELLSGSRRFSDIQRGVPLMSRSVLAQRLRSLCEAGVVERTDDGYALTPAGEELRPIVLECGNWGMRWAHHKIETTEVDVALLMWDMQRRIARDPAFDGDVVVELEFRGAPRGKERFWLAFEDQAVELCLTRPARGVDLEVATTPRTMAAVWLGDLAFHDAVRDGAIEIRGPEHLARAFPRWLRLSVFATEPRTRPDRFA